MRLFTAIELPAKVREALASAQVDLAPRIEQKVSWVAPRNLHLTLKFLGEVEDAEVVRICEAMKSISFPKFSLAISRLGALPPHGPAKVLMADLAGDVDALVRLFDSIEAACEPLGFAREQRRFCPHVTLARLRTPRQVGREFGQVSVKQTQAFEVGEFVLMESEPGAGGSRYETVARVGLR